MAAMKPNRPGGAGWVASFPPSALWLFAILIVQTLCQLGLLFETFAPFRVVFRSGSFGMNFLALFFAYGPRKQPHHPAFWFGAFCMIWIAMQIMNPATNTATSAIATFAMNLAIISPLFWLPRLQITPKVIRTVILYLWGFHTLSAIFGVLQVYYPGQFQPALSQNFKEGDAGLAGVKITLAEGSTIFRPMGLTDLPGGAASAGLYAFVFGLGLFSLSRGPFRATLGVISLPIGLFCIYLSQVRVMIVLGVIISIVYAAVLALTSRLSSAVRVSFVVPIVLVGALAWAASKGGDSTVSRFATLIEDDPDKVIYTQRGHFFEETVEEHLADYPLGAGLGRWGMINSYFGDASLEGSSTLWSEIQWTSWVYDGGIVLMIGYPLGMLVAIWATARVAFLPNYEALASWALLILAYDVAMFAFTFSFPLFASQGGAEFWLLNVMIWTAAQQLPRRAAWRAG